MILLIYPPFAMPDKPYIGLPTLAAKLLHDHIPVTLWDANLSCFQQLLAPEAVARGFNESKARLRQLDKQPTLELSELTEYFSRAVGMGTVETDGVLEIRDLFSDPQLPNRERLTLFGRYLMLVNASNFREHLGMTDNTGYLRYNGPGSPFSTSDLIRCAKIPDSLTRQTCHGELKTLLKTKGPDMIGISVTFPDQILPALILASMVKEMEPGIPVVLGGAFVTIHMGNLTNTDLFSLVDYLALGDGEDILSGLYAHVKDKGRTSDDVVPVKGLMYCNNEKIVHTGGPRVFPMSDSKAPAYGLLPLDEYLIPPKTGAMLFRLSRGCYWAKCAFCNSCSPVINAYDRQALETVYEQLMQTLDVTGCRIVHFTDDAADPEMLCYLAGRLIKEGRDLNWTVNVRVDTRFTLETLLLLRKAGCFSLFLGVETCNDRVLTLMNKGTNTRIIDQVLSNISWSGISANIYMIVGFPTETQIEARESFETVQHWMKEGLVHQVVYNMYSVSPASPVAMDPERYGINKMDQSMEDDLRPPSEIFQCTSGMTRSVVKKEYRDFIRTLQSQLPKASIPWSGKAKYSAQEIKQQLYRQR